MIVFPNCKINLGLHILQKRPDGFHDLETVFYPVPIQDGLEIIQDLTPSETPRFTTSGLAIDAPPEKNICVKAYQLLKKDFPDLPPVKIHLHKVIPMGAGLGGGSSDGAFALMLLNKKFNLGLTEDRLIGYALQLGSDCPFFMNNRPCYASGRGENLEPVHLNLDNYKIVLVNPRIHIDTGQAFSKIVPQSNRTCIKELIQKPVEQWKNFLGNDFEEVIFEEHSEIRAIKDRLYREGALYASMSGSGSTVYGVFEKKSDPFPPFPGHYFVKWI